MGLMTSKGATRELELRLSDNAVSTVSLEVRKMVMCGQMEDCKAARQDHICMPSLEAQLFLLVALASNGLCGDENIHRGNRVWCPSCPAWGSVRTP